MYTIENSTEIQASVHDLQKAITTREGFRAWFAVDTELDADGRFTFSFPQPDHTRAVTFTLDRADQRGIEMTCVHEENNPEWLGTKLTIRLRPVANGKTRIELVHAGYPSKNEVYARCVEGWTYFLSSLTAYATTGVGRPFPASAAAQAVAS